MSILGRIFRWQRKKTTARSLMDQYDRLTDLEHPERLLTLFAGRDAWNGVPEAMLREIVRRLSDGDLAWQLQEVIRFIIIAEECEEASRRGGPVTNLRYAAGSYGSVGTELGLELAGMSLCVHADSMKDLARSTTSLEYARRLAPRNGFVLAKLACFWYAAGDYRQALENCDSALQQLDRLAYMKTLAVEQPELRKDLREMSESTNGFTEVLRSMRIDCQAQLAGSSTTG